MRLLFLAATALTAAAVTVTVGAITGAIAGAGTAAVQERLTECLVL